MLQQNYKFGISLSPNNRVKLSLSPIFDYKKNVKNKIDKNNRYAQAQTGRMGYNVPHSPVCASPLAFPSNCKISSAYAFADIDGAVYAKPKSDMPREKIFTRRARQTLLDAAGAMEKEGIEPSDCVFFTGTIPGDTEESFKMAAKYSRFIVNRLKQYLRDAFGIYLSMNSWEWQYRGALHLHLCFALPSAFRLGRKNFDFLGKADKQLRLISNKIRAKWFDILDDISNDSGVDMYANPDYPGRSRRSKEVRQHCVKVLRCEKNIAAYMSKYLSKGHASEGLKNKKSKYYKALKTKHYPSSWWSISKGLREMIKKYRYQISFSMNWDTANQCFQDMAKFLEGEAILHLGRFSPDKFPSYHYQCSYIKSEEYDNFLDFLRDMEKVFLLCSQLSAQRGEEWAFWRWKQGGSVLNAWDILDRQMWEIQAQEEEDICPEFPNKVKVGKFWFCV